MHSPAYIALLRRVGSSASGALYTRRAAEGACFLRSPVTILATPRWLECRRRALQLQCVGRRRVLRSSAYSLVVTCRLESAARFTRIEQKLGCASCTAPQLALATQRLASPPRWLKCQRRALPLQRVKREARAVAAQPRLWPCCATSALVLEARIHAYSRCWIMPRVQPRN